MGLSLFGFRLLSIDVFFIRILVLLEKNQYCGEKYVKGLKVIFHFSLKANQPKLINQS
jgi:hypothetical protein